MGSSKGVDERREVALLREAANNGDALSTEEGRPVLAVLLGVVGLVLMVLSFLLPS